MYLPNVQYPKSSCAREKGMMTSPRLRSAKAKEAMNQFYAKDYILDLACVIIAEKTHRYFCISFVLTLITFKLT